MKIILCDIDGTIADCEHRLPFISNGKRDYDAFFDAMHLDTPIQPVIDAVVAIYQRHQSHQKTPYKESVNLVFMSGRPDSHLKQTMDWLHENTPFMHFDLYMRTAGDHRPDDVIKEELFNKMLLVHSARSEDVVAVFDDRPRVCALWQRLGLPLFKVGNWNDEKAGRIKKSPVEHPWLVVMVGPSGAGKSTYIKQTTATSAVVISSDDIRMKLLGNMEDQTQNDFVFHAAHTLTKTYLELGLNVIFDATNIKTKDRKAVVALAPKGTRIEYIVIDRPLEDKLASRGWRPEWLILKHHETFMSNKKEILNGDGNPDVEIFDLSDFSKKA